MVKYYRIDLLRALAEPGYRPKMIEDGSEIRKTNDIEVKASEFQVLKRKFGTVDKTVLLYSTKFETDKIDHTIYSVMVHFTTIEGKQINAEEIRG